MRRSPSDTRSMPSTGEWRRARARASRWRPRTSGCAPERRTRRRARRHSFRSARQNFTAAELIRKASSDHHTPTQEQAMPNENIFSGLKVVDLSSFIAGPSAAVILSDLGADVIKVEPPHGDPWRHANKIPIQPLAQDPYQWHLANRNK